MLWGCYPKALLSQSANSYTDLPQFPVASLSAVLNSDTDIIVLHITAYVHIAISSEFSPGSRTLVCAFEG